MKRPRRGIAAAKEFYEPDSDERFAYIAGYTEGGFPYGITWEEMREIENAEKDTIAGEAPSEPRELQPEVVVRFFAGFGIFVDAKLIKAGLSVYTKPDRTPLVRFVPAGEDDSVEVLWWSHRDRWEPIGDFGGVEMPLRDALQYVVDDEPGCFGFSIF